MQAKQPKRADNSARIMAASTHPMSASPILQTHNNYTAPLTRSDVICGLKEAGFQHLEQVPNSGRARIPAIGKSVSNRSASIKYSDDGAVCHWYDWPSGEHGTIFAERQQQVFDPVRRARRIQADKERTKRHEAEQAEQHERVALLARRAWADGYASGEHPYIDTKQLTSLHNARLDVVTDELLIPMWVSGIGLINLQRIQADGTKRFFKGGRKKGAYSVIGSLNDADRVFVATGWATGATLFELHGLPVVVAFDDGNLMSVCQSLRSRFEKITVVIAGDNDRQTSGNPGRTKAIAAAEEIGASLYFPTLCKCCKCSDHNDAAVCARKCGRG